MARSMLSLGIFSFFAAAIAVRRRGLELGSAPPMRAAMVSSRIRRVKTRPRLASVAAFLCLIVAHFECPDMTVPSFFEISLAPRGGEFCLRRTAANRYPREVRAKSSAKLQEFITALPEA